MSDDFHVWAKFPRFDKSGRRIPASKHTNLTVAGLSTTKGLTGGDLARLSFSDGTSTAYFRVNYAKPSFLARSALNFRRFCYAKAKEAEREELEHE